MLLHDHASKATHLLSERQQFGVLVGIGLGFGDARALLRLDATRALKDDWSDEALDLGRLRLGLLLTFLQLQRPGKGKLKNIIHYESEKLMVLCRELLHYGSKKYENDAFLSERRTNQAQWGAQCKAS